MHQLAPLIYDLAIMLGSAAIVVILFQRIRQPVVLGYLIAGMIVGPYTPPHALVNDIPNIKTLSELGVIFLMFSLGLEFSFQKLTRVGLSASITGFIEVVLMFVLGYMTGVLMDWSAYDCIFLGAALSVSSTTIIIKAIDELGLKTKRFAELVFGVLIIEDLLAILMLAALSTMVINHSAVSMELVYATVKLILVVGGWFLVGYFLVPPLFKEMVQFINEETLTIVSVALCLMLVAVAAKLNYSVALGAFIMGSILAETTIVHRIETLIQPIRDIFAAVFFISVGMLIDPAVILANWRIVFLLSIITIVGKIITTGMGAFLSGQSLTTSIRSGFSMAQVGEFSFIIVGLGVALDVTSTKLFPLIVAVSGITTFTTPYLIRSSATLSNWLDKHLPKRIKFFLDRYTAWIFRMQVSSTAKSDANPMITRLVVNALIVGIIFTLIDKLIFPYLFPDTQESWLTNTLSLFAAILFSSPFIWGMLFSYRSTKWPDHHKTALNPVILFIWFITLSEIAILSLLYFHSWPTIAIMIGAGIIFFIASYRQLGESYHWFEQRLVSNIQTKQHEKKFSSLAPWDNHLVEIDVSDSSSLVGKTLGESTIRQRFGVNIVAVCHGVNIVAAPRGEEKIWGRDKLIVLGDDEQLEAFRKIAQTKVPSLEFSDLLENFALRAFLVEAGQKWVGKSIRHTKIRETVKGLIVGMERHNKRILNPDPDTVIEIDDLLFIVGESDKIRELNPQKI